MPLWYISFANSERFLGATIVEAPDPTAALVRAKELHINPGGQALLWPVPSDADWGQTERLRNKLLTKEQLVEGRQVLSLKEIPEDKHATFLAGSTMFCEDHNPG